MDEFSEPRCATCGATSTKRCTRCKTTKYCSKTCQGKDWFSHKKTCRDLHLELMLARAAAVIGEANLTFRKNTWDTTIIKVEDNADALIIHDGDHWNGPQGFVKFPEGVVPKNKRTRLGVLTAWACYEPYAFLENVIRKTLDGLNIEVRELSFGLKGKVPRKTIAVSLDGREPLSNHPGFEHTVLLVNSRVSRKQWVLDFTGGQYGIVETFHAWLDYKAAFVEKIHSICDFGTHKRIVSELAKIPGMSKLTCGVVGEAAAALDGALVSWETNNQSVRKLMTFDNIEFMRHKDSLLEALDMVVQTFKSTNHFVDVVRQAKLDNSHMNRMMAKVTADRISEEANLLI